MITNSQGKIITFYSYKGGVGRSMILANVAWILASNGKRVLVIDWDLEAPGLHRYFHPFLLDKDLSSTEGLMEFVTDFRNAALIPVDESEDDEENWHKPYANIHRYAVSLDWEFPNNGTIDFVPAGLQKESYAKKVNLFDWHDFYERFGGGIFLETVREKMRAEYDYILIDSRAGASQSSGICTVQMPDIVVIVFMANNQSISGAVRVATSVTKHWQANDSRSQNQRAIFPVFARTDQTDKDKLDLTRNYIKNKFALCLQHLSETEREEYWGNVEIPYIPWYAYEEVLVAFRDNPYQRDSLLAPMEQLVTYLTHKRVSELVAPNQEEREKILSQFTLLD
jgi:MinD-like ATPase involved in chromosome partitioning or flagellar assembly